MIPKFRAWDKKKEKMLNFLSLTFDEEGKAFEIWFGNVSYFLNEGRFILIQSTGLKDKNGKEIFEGDIITVNWNNKIKGKVYWDNIGFWAIKWNKDGEESGYNHRVFVFEKKSFEVIGNIHENPELLKEELNA